MAVNKNDNNLDSSLNDAEQGQELHANLNAAAESAKKNAEATDKQTKAASEYTHKMKEGEEALDEFNDALNALPGRLHLITQQMNKNMMFVSGELHDSFIKGKLTEKLWEVKKAFGEQQEELDDIVASAKKAVAVAERGTDEQAKQAAQRKLQQAEEAQRTYRMMTDSEKLNAKLSKEMTAELLKLGKQMFSDLWNYAKNLLNSAYNESKSTIQQSYSTVMSYNSYSQGEYAKVIEDLKAKIDESGLGDVISVNTLQENLVKTLQSGLQGALAETNAYYASVAEKSGITFDWYSSDWTDLISQMNRTGKDYEAVMKSVIATTDDLAEIYGDSKGLADGKANQYMSAASKLGTTYNLDSDAVANIYKSMAITSQELSTYVDPTTIMSDITKVLESGINNDQALLAFATNGMTAEDVKAEISRGNFDELVTNYMSNLEGMFKDQNGEMITAMQSALGGSFSVQDYHALDAYWDNAGDFTSNFNESFSAISSDITDVTGELKNYATTEEKYRNRLENWMAGISEWMVQNPIAEVILTTLMGGIGSIITILIQYMLNKSLLAKFNSGGGGRGGGTSGLYSLGGTFKNAGTAMKSLKGGATFSEVAATSGKGAAVLGKAGQLFSNGTAFASKGGAMANIGKFAFSTGGKALGAGASLISIGVDAYKGYKENGVGGALQSAVTGQSGPVKSGWDVAKGAGSGALKGAGIGMMFGPWGAAIGAAVGGLAGLVVGLSNLETAEERLQRRINGMAESAKKYSKNMEDFTTKLTEFSNTQDLAKNASEGNTDATKELIKKYPQLIKYVDKSGTLQGDYADTLESLMQIEKKKLYRENLYTSGGVYQDSTEKSLHAGNLKETTKQLIDKAPGAAVAQKIDEKSGEASKVAEKLHTTNHWTLDAMTGLVQKYNGDGTQTDAFVLADPDSRKDWYRTQFTDFGLSSDVIDALVADGKIAEGFAIKMGLFGDPTKVIIDPNAEASLKAYDDWKSNYDNVYTQINDTITSLTTAKFTPDQIEFWNTGFSSWSDLIADWPADAEYTPQNTFDRGFQIFTSLNDYAEAAKTDDTIKAALFTGLGVTDFETFKSQYTENKSPLALYKKYNSAAKFSYKPPFAVGTIGESVIPYDNYLAYLHEGEQIRTKAEVTVERAEQHVASSDAVTKVHDVLLTQTNTIISVLTNIYNVLLKFGNTGHIDTKMVYDLPGI